MKKILCLDLSLSRTGWALIEENNLDLTLLQYGNLGLSRKISEYDYYPWSYLRAASVIGQMVSDLVQDHKPDEIVIEETNGSRSRYVQKALEFMHCMTLYSLQGIGEVSVKYVSTSDWRKILGIKVSKEDKKANAKLSRAKREGNLSETKKKLNVRGKKGLKHAAVQWVNQKFGLELKQGDNDVAEAVCLGCALVAGVKLSDGEFVKKKGNDASLV